jgi:hypothetical protein
LQRRSKGRVLIWTAAEAWGCCKMYLYNIQSEVRDGVVTMAMNRNKTT